MGDNKQKLSKKIEKILGEEFWGSTIGKNVFHSKNAKHMIKFIFTDSVIGAEIEIMYFANEFEDGDLRQKLIKNTKHPIEQEKEIMERIKFIKKLILINELFN
jgi:hypothetical protein